MLTGLNDDLDTRIHRYVHAEHVVHQLDGVIENRESAILKGIRVLEHNCQIH